MCSTRFNCDRDRLFDRDHFGTVTLALQNLLLIWPNNRIEFPKPVPIAIWSHTKLAKNTRRITYPCTTLETQKLNARIALKSGEEGDFNIHRKKRRSVRHCAATFTGAKRWISKKKEDADFFCRIKKLYNSSYQIWLCWKDLGRLQHYHTHPQNTFYYSNLSKSEILETS